MKSPRVKPKNKIKRTAALLAGLGLALGAVFLTALALTPDPFPQTGYEPSIRIEDRNGYLLTEFLSSRETITRWIALEDISPWLVKAAVAAEDKRFYSHQGVDILAVFRAVVQNVTAGQVISGASTITMQLVRILEPGPRTLNRKIVEAFKALRLELSHDKKEILEQYLNRVPCGNLVYGVSAAARLYLDKSAANLSPAEAAFLASLPQAPGALNPFRRRDRALARRSLIINRMEALNFLSPEEAGRARVEPLVLASLARNFSAPHFVTHIRSLLPSPAPEIVRTTLNLDLQTKIEQLVGRVIAQGKIKDINQAAVLVMDHETREILAWVGSADFFDPREGQNDGVKALRQPGSAIKPFTYAAAFDSGLNPATMIDDSPVDYGLDRGVYSPANYDEQFHGPVSLRTALASSLNVPAVKLLDKVGLPRVHALMKQAGLNTLDREPDYYGLGLTLGSGEVNLLSLANAYATLASGGEYRPPVFFLNPERGGRDNEQPRQVFSPQAAYLVTNILSDDPARLIGFGRDSLLSLPFPAAAKTGTSKNFRDNWTVGYTSRVVVAVWGGQLRFPAHGPGFRHFRGRPPLAAGHAPGSRILSAPRVPPAPGPGRNDRLSGFRPEGHNPLPQQAGRTFHGKPPAPGILPATYAPDRPGKGFPGRARRTGHPEPQTG